MKKIKLATLALSACGAVLVGGSALAATADTTGVINFIPNGGSTIIKPKPPTGPEEIIELPGEGTGTTGESRISFVPNLTFMDQELTAGEINSNAKYIKYNKKGETTPRYLPPFVQVAYGSGDAKGFSLRATASEFKTTGDKPLAGAQIIINESKLFNNYKDASTILEAPVAGSDFTRGATVLATKPTETADGSISSNVFDASYNENTAYTAADTTAGIKFFKPKGEAPSKGLYTSTITWTLEIGLP